MIITITPCAPAPYPKKWAGMFEARLGDRLLCTSRQPFVDAARVLVAEGHDPGTIASMRYAGSDGLTVIEDGPKFRKWTPFKWPTALSGSANQAPGGAKPTQVALAA